MATTVGFDWVLPDRGDGRLDMIPTSVPSGSNQDRINAALLLRTGSTTLPTQVAGFQPPADPTATAVTEVRNNAELSAAFAAGNNDQVIRIFGPANGGQAIYGQFIIPVGGISNIDVIMDNDATIQGPRGLGWFNAMRQFRWTGGNFEFTGFGDSSGLRLADMQDVMFDNVNFYGANSDPGTNILYPGATREVRICFVNCTMEWRAGTSGNGYSEFLAAPEGLGQDIAHINCRHIGTGPPVRYIRPQDRLVMVGNYYGYLGPSGGVRVHENVRGWWYGYNYITRLLSSGNSGPLLKFEVSGEGATTPQFSMDNALINFNRLFQNGGQAGAYQIGDVGSVPNRAQMTNFVISDNRIVDVSGPSAGTNITTGILITAPYVQERDLHIGPGHPDYAIDPGPSGFGAQR